MNLKDLFVVGIGSSAGGLEALQVMLSKLSGRENCAYIIAQHLSPTHKSMMVELLSRVTNIPIIEIQNGMLIKPKTIYMTPENTDVYVAKGKIYFKNIEQTYGPKPSVNFFFNSLGQTYGDHSIGVILSGTGSDGAFGVRAIKASGGITIAQTPSTAKYDGMPNSAINTGKVDIVVPIDGISAEIERIIETFGKDIGDGIHENLISTIFKILFDEFGVDFSQYKKSTVLRRIQRRLSAVKRETLFDYLDYLKDNKEEAQNLYNDILIGVTEFFRDKDTFALLREFLEKHLEKKEQGEEIRFWSIGCSTGEEAYTLAILLCEILGEKVSKYKIKIFATDIDDESLKIARAGVYADTSLLNVPKEYVQRYFMIVKNHFEVKKSIRELVVFSKHNIVSDSPFLRLDFISCRNMLIYFNQNLQDRFFPIVHYALKQDGILFLGKSESLGQSADLFVPLDKKEKIYKAQYRGVKESPRLYSYVQNYKTYSDAKNITSSKNEEQILEEKITEAAKEYILDKCVVLNSSNEILYIKGQNPYMIYAQGRATNNIFKSIKEDLVLDLRSALNEAQKFKKIRLTPYRSIEIIENIFRYVRIAVVPISSTSGEDWLYALFFQAEEVDNIVTQELNPEVSDEFAKKLQQELTSTKSHLQNVIEELEASYEEMQSLNEELSSSNEELQSSNEELETTNEELQSTNEELQTAYSELKVLYDDKEEKTKQLKEFSDILREQTEDYRKQKEVSEAIINTTPIAILMLDEHEQITFANPAALKLFDSTKQELMGKAYFDASFAIKDFHDTPLEKEQLPFAQIKKTYEAVFNMQHTIESKNGEKKYISVSGAPLFDSVGKFLGAVLSIEDISLLTNINYKRKYDEEMRVERMAKEVADGYKTLKSFDLSDTLATQFNLIEIAMMGVTTTLKNSLSELALASEALAHEQLSQTSKKALLEQFKESIADMNEVIGQNTLFYNDILTSKSISFEKLLKRVFHIGAQTLKEHQLSATFKSSIDVAYSVDAKIYSKFLLEFLNAIVDIKNHTSDEAVELEIQTIHIENDYFLQFVFVDCVVNEEHIEHFNKFEYSCVEYKKIASKTLKLEAHNQMLSIVMEL